MTTTVSTDGVREFLLGLQDRICAALEGEDGSARFREERFEGERGGLARPRVLTAGAVFEKAAVHFSHTRGAKLPPAATERKPELVGRGFEALSVSLITHPQNPYVPTSHANFRCFSCPGDPAAWWFGGGFDLTPTYGFEEDVLHWHRTAKRACDAHGADYYARFKEWCDRYFHLPHRGEPRGVGGLFFDDLVLDDFERTFAFVRDVANSYVDAYVPIVNRRKELPFGARERDFQLYRRGRYAEFNLLYDRGTKHGLQAGGRTESILASLPPLVRWEYGWSAEPGSEEERLSTDFLRARDWLSELAGEGARG